MGLVLALLVVAVIGIIIAIASEFDMLGPMVASVGIIGLVVSIILLIVLNVGVNDRLIEYQQDSVIVSMACRGENITGKERANAISVAVKDNNIILKHRYWNKNFWIGWFYPKPIEKLELFDIEKINQANLRITIDKE